MERVHASLLLCAPAWTLHCLCIVNIVEVHAGTNRFDEPRQPENSHCQQVLPWPDERSVLYGAEEAFARITQKGRVSAVFQTRRARGVAFGRARPGGSLLS